jgi:hypothetical protein
MTSEGCGLQHWEGHGNFQEPYGAVLVEGDDMAALVEGDDMAALPSNRLRKRRGCRCGGLAVEPIRMDEADGATLPTVDGGAAGPTQPTKPASAL